VILISKTQIDVKMKLLTGTWKDAHNFSFPARLIHWSIFFLFQRKERHKRKPFIGSIRTKQSSDKNEFRVLIEQTTSQKDRGEKNISSQNVWLLILLPTSFSWLKSRRPSPSKKKCYKGSKCNCRVGIKKSERFVFPINFYFRILKLLAQF
jgi:hypothetical protein